jgi:BirA family biotin operon repressor/biotin-[acetyl-CoA-carboxylase] ligase
MKSYQDWKSEIDLWQKSRAFNVIGKNAIVFSEIGSTNNFIKENPDLENGTVVITQKQTQGRGQKNRSWLSNPGGLYFSIKLDLNPYSNFQPFWATAIASLGLCEALKELKLSPIIKWPNDILINDKKVAGVLTDTIITNSNITTVIGVGINVNNSLEEIFTFFPDLQNKITSIENEIPKYVEIKFTDILNSIVEKLEATFFQQIEPNISSIKEEWLKYSLLNNKIVKIQNVNLLESYEGVVAKITDSGSLIIKLSSGEYKEFTAGDIKVKK